MSKGMECMLHREKEQIIKQNLSNGVDTAKSSMTVCELYAMYTRQRGNVKRGTHISRDRLMKCLKNDVIGSCSIDSVKTSDAREWAVRMKKNGIAYQTISNDKRSLKSAFYTAIQDDIIRRNPFDFQLNTVLNNDTKPRQPLTERQEKNLLNFVSKDKVYRRYYDDIVILLGTGLRISELCGLTVSDVDFKGGFIKVDHQLLKNSDNGYYIETPKTKSSIRIIPMCTRVSEAVSNVLRKRDSGKYFEVDGYKDFIFLSESGRPKTCIDYDGLFKRIIKKYNKSHHDSLPEMTTPHTMRHTFCTKLANMGMNPKALQYIMGHSSITMTLDYYAHATFESARDEFDRVLQR